MFKELEKHRHLIKTNKPYRIINEICDAIIIASVIIGGILWIAL